MRIPSVPIQIALRTGACFSCDFLAVCGPPPTSRLKAIAVPRFASRSVSAHLPRDGFPHHLARNPRTGDLAKRIHMAPLPAPLQATACRPLCKGWNLLGGHARICPGANKPLITVNNPDRGDGMTCAFCQKRFAEGEALLCLCPDCAARLASVSPLRAEYPWFIAAMRRALFGY